jgi:transthyretin-like family protein
MTVQRVSAKGTLLCGANPSSGSQSSVQLLNKRIGADDSVQAAPRSDGTFALDLNVDRNYTIEPQLWIYTNCAAETLGIPPGCTRLQKIKVPSTYINSGRPYDLGTRNLATKAPDEEQNCPQPR